MSHSLEYADAVYQLAIAQIAGAECLKRYERLVDCLPGMSDQDVMIRYEDTRKKLKEVIAEPQPEAVDDVQMFYLHEVDTLLRVVMRNKNLAVLPASRTVGRLMRGVRMR